MTEAMEALERDAPNAPAMALPLLAHAPYDLDLHRALARYYIRSGDGMEAKHHIEACVDMAEWPDLLETLAPPRALRKATFDAIGHARTGMSTRCRIGNLLFTQLEPTLEEFSLVLRWPEAHNQRVQEAVDDLAVQCGRIGSLIEGKARNDKKSILLAPTMKSPFQCQHDVSCVLTPSIWGSVGLVLRTLETIAPWLDDVRFLARVDGAALHECWIVAGCFYTSRLVTPLYRDSTSGMAEYLESIYLSTDGNDDALRHYVLELWSQTFPLRLDVWKPEPDEAVLRGAERAIARMRKLGKEPDFMIARLACARGNLPATAAALRPLAAAGHRIIHLELARVLVQLEEYDEALSWAALAADAAYHDDSRMLAARAAAQMGDEARSHEWLRREAEFRSNSSPGVVLQEARALVDLGDFDGARILYEGLLSVPRYEARARDGLALCVKR